MTSRTCSKRHLLGASAALSIALLLAACGPETTGEGPSAASSSELPNIILILADDMGYGDPGSYNPDSKIPTPHMDRLAAEGMRFTDAHSPSGVCTPTRYGLLTGRYSWRTHLKKGVTRGYSPSLIDTNRTTVASLLKQQGYATGGVGKWHLGLGDPERTDYSKPLRPGPASLGFDYFYGIPASLDFEPYLYFENDHVVEAPTDSTPGNLECCFGAFWRKGAMSPGFEHDQVLPITAEKAVAFIEDQGATEQPFFLYVPLSAPHTPWLPLPPYVGTTEVGEYGDFTAQVDGVVGQILDAVDRLAISDNTLVILTSDNGAIWPQSKIDEFGHRANLNLRGQKADIWEGGNRVPFIARWPGHIAPGSQSDALVSLTDMLATFAAITGADLPGNAGEDSYNILPLLLGEESETPLRDAAILHSSQGMFAIRQGPWKLIEGRGSGGFTAPAHIDPAPGEPAGQLYNLAEDISETNNLYQQHPDVVARLTALLDQYRQQGHSRPASLQ